MPKKAMSHHIPKIPTTRIPLVKKLAFRCKVMNGSILKPYKSAMGQSQISPFRGFLPVYSNIPIQACLNGLKFFARDLGKIQTP